MRRDVLDRTRRPPSEASRLRRKRPRRLLIAPPSDAATAATSEPDDDDGEAFEFDPEPWMDLLWSSGVPPRPLPLLSTLGSRGGRGGRRGGGGGGSGGADPSSTTTDGSDPAVPLLSDFAEALKRTAAALRRPGGGEVEVRADGRGDDGEIGSTGVPAGNVEAVGGGRDRDGPSAEAASAVTAAGEADASRRPPSATANPLDNPRSSTLTLGQHARYRFLLAEIEKNGKITDAQKRKELRKLRDAVKEERRSYGAALDEFREENRERFAIGFKVRGPASGFVGTNSELVSQYKRAWLDSTEFGGRNDRPPTKYGKCVQAISLRSSAAFPPDGEAMDFGTKLDVESFSPRVVHSTGDAYSVPVTVQGWLDPPSSRAETSVRLKPPVVNDSSRKGPPGLLGDDETAKRLAVEHRAAVVLTSGALEALLQRPGDRSTRWTIPLSTATATAGGEKDGAKSTAHRRGASVVFVEDPVPHPSTPRECLARGFLESLYGALSRPPSSASDSRPSSEAAGASSSGDVQFVYTLLTIPPPAAAASSSGRHGACRALVRTANRLLDDDGNPVRLRVNLEYFPERGYEECTSHQRVLWMMDEMLQPAARSALGRIDPNDARLLRVEEKGVAHALAGASGGGAGEGDEDASSGLERFAERFDPSAHLRGAADLIRAATKIGDGRYVLCMPGRGVPTGDPTTSVSVHRACVAVDRADPAGRVGVDLESEQKEADAVFLGPTVLVGCFRNWVWEADRVPYTFPVQEDSGPIRRH